MKIIDCVVSLCGCALLLMNFKDFTNAYPHLHGTVYGMFCIIVAAIYSMDRD